MFSKRKAKVGNIISSKIETVAPANLLSVLELIDDDSLEVDDSGNMLEADPIFEFESKIPEKNLLFEVINFAYFDLFNFHNTDDALLWIMSAGYYRAVDSRYPFRFENLCELLGFDIDALRKQSLGKWLYFNREYVSQVSAQMARLRIDRAEQVLEVLPRNLKREDFQAAALAQYSERRKAAEAAGVLSKPYWGKVQACLPRAVVPGA